MELCKVALEAQQGKADDLGGGVYKKRLNLNLHRSILLAKRGDDWVFVFLYAKQDKANIEADELAGFRKLAKSYDAMTATQLSGLIAELELTEICNVT